MTVAQETKLPFKLANQIKRRGLFFDLHVTLILILLVLGLSVVATACQTNAADQDIEKMCAHLMKLRNDMNIKTDVKNCIADAKKEGISSRQALCRISAVNVNEYWVRCRTGSVK